VGRKEEEEEGLEIFAYATSVSSLRMEQIQLFAARQRCQQQRLDCKECGKGSDA